MTNPRERAVTGDRWCGTAEQVNTPYPDDRACNAGSSCGLPLHLLPGLDRRDLRRLLGLLQTFDPGELTLSAEQEELVLALPPSLHRALRYIAATLLDGRVVRISDDVSPT